MSGDGKPKTKATNGYLNAVSVGKMLTDQGVGVWQHPDFNIKSGFTGSGLEGMMKRALILSIVLVKHLIFLLQVKVKRD